MEYLKDLQLYKEDGIYYLSALIGYEDNYGVYDISIPKIEFPVTTHLHGYITTCCGNKAVSLDLGFGEMYAKPVGDTNTFFTITCVEEKVHEMTLADIEKELGYKIKLKEK